MSSREYGTPVTCQCGHSYRSNIIGQSGCPWIRPCHVAVDKMARLDEFDEIEWWDICRKLRPDWTEDQFAQAWAQFVEIKREHARRKN